MKSAKVSFSPRSFLAAFLFVFTCVYATVSISATSKSNSVDTKIPPAVNEKQSLNWVADTQTIMGTEINVVVLHQDKDLAQKAVESVMQEMQRIDKNFSPYIKSSQLSQLNLQASKKSVKVSAELYHLIDKSLNYSTLTEGAFDISFASVGWYYDYRKQQQPTKAQLEKLLPAVNYKFIQLNKAEQSITFLHADVRLDLGGIAKGYAVDRAAELLKQMGIYNASVSAGGDSRLLGDRNGRPWIVGIKHPRSDKTESVIKLPLSETAISTSGDYERYFVDAQTGKRVHHIINPKTGQSAFQVVSVTILGDKGIDTDPLSTSVFVLGVEKGVELVNQLDGIECIIIDNQGQVFYSEGLMAGS